MFTNLKEGTLVEWNEWISKKKHAFYDFKNESSDETVVNETDAVKKFLRYRLSPEGKSTDCDRTALALAAYEKLWQLDPKHPLFEPDTMNSFRRIYRLCLRAYDAAYWDEAGKLTDVERLQWLLSDDVFTHYAEINLHPTVQKFAALTHSIGNFTVVPKGFNMRRNASLHDYWDVTMAYFEAFLGKKGFQLFVQKYTYEAYVKKDGFTPKTYWKEHTLHTVGLPQHKTVPDILRIIDKMNDAIEQRGKQLMKQLRK